MTKEEKEIAELAVDAGEKICKSIDGFEELNNDSKAIATIFAAIYILNKAFDDIGSWFTANKQ